MKACSIVAFTVWQGLIPVLVSLTSLKVHYTQKCFTYMYFYLYRKDSTVTVVWILQSAVYLAESSSLGRFVMKLLQRQQRLFCEGREEREGLTKAGL